MPIGEGRSFGPPGALGCGCGVGKPLVKDKRAGADTLMGEGAAWGCVGDCGCACACVGVGAGTARVERPGGAGVWEGLADGGLAGALLATRFLRGRVFFLPLGVLKHK